MQTLDGISDDQHSELYLRCCGSEFQASWQRSIKDLKRVMKKSLDRRDLILPQIGILDSSNWLKLLFNGFFPEGS